MECHATINLEEYNPYNTRSPLNKENITDAF